MVETFGRMDFPHPGFMMMAMIREATSLAEMATHPAAPPQVETMGLSTIVPEGTVNAASFRLHSSRMGASAVSGGRGDPADDRGVGVARGAQSLHAARGGLGDTGEEASGGLRIEEQREPWSSVAKLPALEIAERARRLAWARELARPRRKQSRAPGRCGTAARSRSAPRPAGSAFPGGGRRGRSR